MSNETWLIKIYHLREGQVLAPMTAASHVVLRDRHLFGRLYSVLNRFIQPSGSSDWVHKVKIDSSAPELQKALELLAEIGLKPAFQSFIPPEQRGRLFPVRRERPEFSLDSSNWLQLMCVRANRGGEIVSFHDGHLVARADKIEAKRSGHCLDLTYRAYAVTEDFKNSFNDAGLVGAIFRPLEYDPPVPGCKRKYWMDTNVVAPWCPWIRRIQMLDTAEDCVGVAIKETNAPLVGHSGGLDFDDEGYQGPGIAYRKTDMASYDGVDFMSQAEWTVEHNGVWRSEHIVSQRFRAWAKKFGCRFVMNGVKLID